MSDQEQILDCICHKKVSDPVIVRDIFCDLFSQDLILQRIQPDKISLTFKWPVNALVVSYPFFKGPDRFFSSQVFEFREVYFPENTGL